MTKPDTADNAHPYVTDRNDATHTDTLAEDERTPSANQRRDRLSKSAILAGICAASLVSYFADLYDEKISTASLLIHNAIGTTAMIGAIIYLVIGLCTPRRPRPYQMS